MNLYDILNMRGFNLTARTKMMRHQDTRYDVEMLHRRGLIESYQSVQGQDCLNCDYLIAFMGKDQTKASFAGVWKVLGRTSEPDPKYVEGFPYENYFTVTGDIYYKLEPVPGYEDLIDRVIIDWGKATRSWHQWLKNKPVIEVLPKGQVKPFPGYLDFVLSFEELTQMVNSSDANRTWHQMLKSVAGIYLITDTKTGLLYVGSAYGKDGILGRWQTYVQTGHGNNVLLREIMASDANRKQDLAFTILRTLPSTLTAKEVIVSEKLYKQKLGSIVHGLNMN